jgi:two-component system, LuxR family, response regulator FixJ
MTDSTVVHVIDDDEALRDSLVFLLAAVSLEARGYDCAASFLEALPQISGGCIVSDVRMPGMSGIELLRHLRQTGSELPVIVITGHGDVPLAVEAMKAGAFDFIEKPFDDEALVNAVRAALSHRSRASERDGERDQVKERISILTAREREVFDGLVAGHPNKTIAYDLGISPRTVEIYRANVMTKMQAGSLSELVRMAFVAEGPVRSSQD